MTTNVLELQGISKQFPGVLALDNVSLTLKKAEILGLVGENGAGKSTLMKIIGGAYKATKGKILLDNKELIFNSTQESLKNGISIVYQELNLIPHLSVAENIFINRLNQTNGFVNWKKLYQDAEKILSANGMTDINPRATVSDLAIGQKQSVEIAKALSYNSKILLLDEPTSSLAGPEIQNLFNIIARLKEQGISIIYISHHLDEIFEICNRVQILRDGKNIDVSEILETNQNTVVSKMVGRDIEDIYFKSEHNIGDKILEIEGLNDSYLKSINLNLKRSEVLGIYGLMGSGRTELLKAIYGARKSKFESFKLNNQNISIKHPIDAIKHGIIYSSEDRKSENLFFGNPIWKNISYLALQTGSFATKGFINHKQELAKSKDYYEKLNVKAPTIEADVYNLSGGNQQKVCLAKALINEPEIILLDEPTRGIDVGAKLEIYKLIANLTAAGKSIILVSSELPEIIGSSDRVYSMANGRITQEFIGEEINEKNILRYCLQKETLEASA